MYLQTPVVNDYFTNSSSVSTIPEGSSTLIL